MERGATDAFLVQRRQMRRSQSHIRASPWEKHRLLTACVAENTVVDGGSSLSPKAGFAHGTDAERGATTAFTHLTTLWQLG
jgi:hypothetical protein